MIHFFAEAHLSHNKPHPIVFLQASSKSTRATYCYKEYHPFWIVDKTWVSLSSPLCSLSSLLSLLLFSLLLLSKFAASEVILEFLKLSTQNCKMVIFFYFWLCPVPLVMVCLGLMFWGFFCTLTLLFLPTPTKWLVLGCSIQNLIFRNTDCLQTTCFEVFLSGKLNSLLKSTCLPISALCCSLLKGHSPRQSGLSASGQ